MIDSIYFYLFGVMTGWTIALLIKSVGERQPNERRVTVEDLRPVPHGTPIFPQVTTPGADFAIKDLRREFERLRKDLEKDRINEKELQRLVTTASCLGGMVGAAAYIKKKSPDEIEQFKMAWTQRSVKYAAPFVNGHPIWGIPRPNESEDA